MPVLILVLMEDGLGLTVWPKLGITEKFSLNPCFNGRWSRTVKETMRNPHIKRLNPCFNGRWSRTKGDIVVLDSPTS